MRNSLGFLSFGFFDYGLMVVILALSSRLSELFEDNEWSGSVPFFITLSSFLARIVHMIWLGTLRVSWRVVINGTMTVFGNVLCATALYTKAFWVFICGTAFVGSSFGFGENIGLTYGPYFPMHKSMWSWVSGTGIALALFTLVGTVVSIELNDYWGTFFLANFILIIGYFTSYYFISTTETKEEKKRLNPSESHTYDTFTGEIRQKQQMKSTEISQIDEEVEESEGSEGSEGSDKEDDSTETDEESKVEHSSIIINEEKSKESTENLPSARYALSRSDHGSFLRPEWHGIHTSARNNVLLLITFFTVSMFCMMIKQGTVYYSQESNYKELYCNKSSFMDDLICNGPLLLLTVYNIGNCLTRCLFHRLVFKQHYFIIIFGLILCLFLIFQSKYNFLAGYAGIWVQFVLYFIGGFIEGFTYSNAFYYAAKEKIASSVCLSLKFCV